MWKWIRRIGGGIFALIVVATSGLVIAYFVWLSDYKRELEEGSQIASTPLGEIEYAIAGEGTPMLRLHGSPGGYDQSIIAPRARPETFAGLRVIAPSRPGYLRTPLAAARTAAEQADLYAALLDHLGIKRVIVYGVSGGGPSALQFAVRHPNRTLGLILVVPNLVTNPEYDNQMSTGSAFSLFVQDFGFWLPTQMLNERVVSIAMPKMMRGFNAQDPLHIALMREVGRGFIPASLRVAGRENDVAQYRTLGIESWPLETMSTPTLILHGNADANAPYKGSVRAAARIPNAELVTFDGGEHTIVLTRTHEINERIKRFVRGLGT